MRKKLLLVMMAFLLVGAGCGGPSQAEQAATRSVKLKVWRVFDDDSGFQLLMNNYRRIHPNVSFEYRKLRLSEYEDELLRAFAEGVGPDIFAVHNTWLPEYKALISPMPDRVTIPYIEIRGKLKKEKVYTLREEKTLPISELNRDYVDAVPKDVILSYKKTARSNPEPRIYGVPLFVDTLALYYNKDLLNAAGIAQPPKTWNEFQTAVQKLTVVGRNDEVIQAGAAIGTSRNVSRAFDILSLLMMQNGTPMTDARGRPAFTAELDSGAVPASQALQFYTDFANPSTSVYTWNAAQPDSFEAFVNGKTAFFFGYTYHLPAIRARAEKLNFAVAHVPQISPNSPTNYANYWVETVAKASRQKDFAWDFVTFAASSDQVINYLKSAKRPTALRPLIAEQREVEDMRVFVDQVLTAKSWYKGRNASAAENAFLGLIDAVLAGQDVMEALNTAQNKVMQTL